MTWDFSINNKVLQTNLSYLKGSFNFIKFGTTFDDIYKLMYFANFYFPIGELPKKYKISIVPLLVLNTDFASENMTDKDYNKYIVYKTNLLESRDVIFGYTHLFGKGYSHVVGMIYDGTNQYLKIFDPGNMFSKKDIKILEKRVKIKKNKIDCLKNYQTHDIRGLCFWFSYYWLFINFRNINEYCDKITINKIQKFSLITVLNYGLFWFYLLNYKDLEKNFPSYLNSYNYYFPFNISKEEINNKTLNLTQIETYYKHFLINGRHKQNNSTVGSGFWIADFVIPVKLNSFNLKTLICSNKKLFNGPINVAIVTFKDQTYEKDPLNHTFDNDYVSLIYLSNLIEHSISFVILQSRVMDYNGDPSIFEMLYLLFAKIY